MNNRKHQRGMGTIGFLCLLIVLGGGAFIGYKVIPIYLESYKINRILASVSTAADTPNKSKIEIVRDLIKRLGVDDVTRFTEKNYKQFIKVDKKGSIVKISVKYQAEAPLVANLRLIADFEMPK